jgi:hypothetical protein
MVGAWEHLPAARVPAPLAPHVVAMDGYCAEGLAPGVHRGLPSAGLTLVLSLERPLRTAPTEEAWADGVRDEQWVSLGGLHTRPAMVEQPGRWAGVQLTLHPVGVRRLLGVPASDLPVGSWDARDLLGREVERVVDELHAAPDWPGRYAAVGRLLLRLVDRADRGTARHGPSPEVAEAWAPDPAAHGRDGARPQDAPAARALRRRSARGGRRGVRRLVAGAGGRPDGLLRPVPPGA